MSHRRLLLVVACSVVLVDQLTKWWAVQRLDDGPIVLIRGVLRLELSFNPGAAFSSFLGSGPLLGVLALIVAVTIVASIDRVSAVRDVVAFGMIMGGALGNFVDRIARGAGFLDGHVVDWIHVSYWPTFNAADSAITIGVVLLLLGAFFSSDG